MFPFSLLGTAGDCLDFHRGMPFSTKDRDNDKSWSKNCALSKKGAWWYNDCHNSNLNGLYLPGKITNDGIGMNWIYWKLSWYSVQKSEMKIR